MKYVSNCFHAFQQKWDHEFVVVAAFLFHIFSFFFFLRKKFWLIFVHFLNVLFKHVYKSARKINEIKWSIKSVDIAFCKVFKTFLRCFGISVYYVKYFPISIQLYRIIQLKKYLFTGNKVDCSVLCFLFFRFESINISIIFGSSFFSSNGWRKSCACSFAQDTQALVKPSLPFYSQNCWLRHGCASHICVYVL